MKIFPWLLTLAFIVVCLSCWAMSELVMHSIRDMKRLDYIPWFTGTFIRSHSWILACPVPWLVYSTVLSFRREVTPSALFVFAGTLFLAAAVVTCVVVIAAVLPYIPLHM
jgi:hypothetical protein